MRTNQLQSQLQQRCIQRISARILTTHLRRSIDSSQSSVVGLDHCVMLLQTDDWTTHSDLCEPTSSEFAVVSVWTHSQVANCKPTHTRVNAYYSLPLSRPISTATTTGFRMSSAATSTPERMKAILVQQPGHADQLVYGEAPTPKPGKKELLIKIHATACNRADTLQREGKYPAPPGASPLLGLECVGEVVALGEGATKFPVGAKVMALLGGGGYAQYTNVDEGSVLPIPSSLSYEEAAAIPEVFLTAYLIARQLGGLRKDDIVLIHAGASGVGTALIQLCKQFGAHAIVSVSNDSKAAYCKSLGAVHSINYQKDKEWSKDIKAFCSTLGRDGVSLVLDPVGASHAHQNLESLGMDGRWILYGTMGGVDIDKFSLGPILRKRIRLEGSTLRSRSLQFKAELIDNFAKECLPKFGTGELKPIIEKVFKLSEMRQAHELMEGNQTIGKIVIKVEH